MLKLGVPSKGRLQDKTFDWFAGHEMRLRLSGTSREYKGVVEGVDGVALVLLSASEIPRELAAGRLHLGVTGQDLIAEKIHKKEVVSEVVPLGFGHANLVLAVPDFWVDAETVEDLDAIAAQFRAQHGRRLRIATKYHNIMRAYLRERGVADYTLVDSQGATEGVVKNQTAEVIADITSTGETLRANHLRALSDGPILRSEATLFASCTADYGAGEQRAMNDILTRIGSASIENLW